MNIYCALIAIAVLLPALPACMASSNNYELESTRTEPSAEVRQSGDPQAAPKTGEIRVRIEALRNRKGQVLVSLFASSKGFPAKAKHAAARSVHKIDDSYVEARFMRVPAGTYAIAVLHDEDMNFKMKTGLFGIPQEGYGVSNNARGRFGPPRFSDAKFKVAGQRVDLRIELVYH